MRLPWQRGNRHEPEAVTHPPLTDTGMTFFRCRRCGAWRWDHPSERWYPSAFCPNAALPLPAAPGERAGGLPVPADPGPESRVDKSIDT